jgi:excisionase family DNA binding protein
MRSDILTADRVVDLTPLYTIAEAMAYLKVGHSRIYVLMKRGHLPYVCLGPNGSRRITQQALATFIGHVAAKAA